MDLILNRRNEAAKKKELTRILVRRPRFGSHVFQRSGRALRIVNIIIIGIAHDLGMSREMRPGAKLYILVLG